MATALAVAQPAGAAQGGSAAVGPASSSVLELLRKERLRLNVRSRRAVRLRAHTRSGGRSVAIAKPVRMRAGKRARKRASLRITKKGRKALRGCVQKRRIVVRARSSGARRARVSRFDLPCGESMRWTSYERAPTNAITVDRNVPIEMRDGTVLDANISRPDEPGRFPVILIQNAYGKDGVGEAFSGTINHLASRGYAVVHADARGTGGSQGMWDAFGEAEQADGAELVRWSARRPWSNGKVGLAGASYMGLNQLLTAARRPKGLKAVFPVVPMADGYRDIVFSGGAPNVGFIPLWLGLVTAGGITPPPYALSGNPDDLLRGVEALASHLAGAVNFQVKTLLDAVLGADIAYDGPFWKTRSPLEVVDRIRVPAFVVGGHHDIFQRGEPLIYERLKNRVPTRLLMGPWTHVEAAMGNDLPRDGVPAIDSLQLRWFDHWLKGIDTGIDEIPRVTQYALGEERYETQRDWPDRRLDVKRLFMRGGGGLSERSPSQAEPAQGFLQHPLSGICTRSTSQWTAGLGGQIPCTQDNRLNEALGDAVYTTAPLERELKINGPITADVWLKTTARDAPITVRVTDVEPSGRSRELTSGWLAASFRAVDRSKTRRVRGEVLQPWHPYTRDSVLPVEAGEPVRLSVEVFPTRATIRKGHSLRVTVSPSDFPHQLPTLPMALDSLAGQVSILSEPGRESSIALPVPGKRCAKGKRPKAKHCPSLPVPDLTRG